MFRRSAPPSGGGGGGERGGERQGEKRGVVLVVAVDGFVGEVGMVLLLVAPLSLMVMMMAVLLLGC